MTKLSNDFYLPPANAAKISTTGDNGALGKDAFLKILITQLQNQDPTSPMDDKEFISQMAQFSSLEQMQNMTTAMKDLLDSQLQTQMMSYTNFIGKEIRWHEILDGFDEKGFAKTAEGKGVINELKFVKGEPVFVLDSGKEITPGNISSILSGGAPVPTTSTGPANPFAEASQLIGQLAQYSSGGALIQQLIEAVKKNTTGFEFIMKNGDHLTKDQFELISSSSSDSKETL